MAGALVPCDLGPAPTEDLAGQLAALCQVRDGGIRAFAPQVRAALGLPEAEPGPVAEPPVPATEPASPPFCATLAGGRAMVVQDTSLPEPAWLAALRGEAASLIDPDFLLDGYGRIRRFESAQDAKDASLAALRVRAGREVC